MLEFQGLTKIYRTEEVETTVLDAVNLQVVQGEFVAVMGPSGCGKSTLLNIAGLLDRPSSGDYRFGDQKVSTMKEKELSQIRKRHMGFVFQSFNLIDDLTVFENVELPLLYQKIDAGARKSRVHEALELVGVAHRAKHRPQQLSGGQQQRVAVARAVVAKPQLILADEPTGNLDVSNGRQVMELLKELHGKSTTILMVTHSEADAAAADRIVRMIDGTITTDRRRVAV